MFVIVVKEPATMNLSFEDEASVSCLGDEELSLLHNHCPMTDYNEVLSLSQRSLLSQPSFCALRDIKEEDGDEDAFPKAPSGVGKDEAVFPESIPRASESLSGDDEGPTCTFQRIDSRRFRMKSTGRSISWESLGPLSSDDDEYDCAVGGRRSSVGSLASARSCSTSSSNGSRLSRRGSESKKALEGASVLTPESSRRRMRKLPTLGSSVFPQPSPTRKAPLLYTLPHIERPGSARDLKAVDKPPTCPTRYA